MVALLAGSATAAAQGCGNGAALQVLGSGGAEMTGKRAASSLLFWIDGKPRVLIDVGGGAALRFAESGAATTDLDVLLLTRLYADHTSDLPALVEAAKLQGRARALPIYGPPASRLMPSTVMFVRETFDNVRGTYRYLGDLISPFDKTSYKLEPHDVVEPPAKIGAPRPRPPAPIPVFRNERVRILAMPVTQGNIAALAYRIEAGDRTVVVAGDAGGDDTNLRPLGGGIDVLAAAHAVPEGAATAGPWPTPAMLGKLAQNTGARQLVLVHRSSATAGHEEESLAAIRKTYSGAVHFADDLGCYHLQ
jgi:ribonuclease BN (tRNA processing enzyme)